MNAIKSAATLPKRRVMYLAQRAGCRQLQSHAGSGDGYALSSRVIDSKAYRLRSMRWALSTSVAVALAAAIGTACGDCGRAVEGTGVMELMASSPGAFEFSVRD